MVTESFKISSALKDIIGKELITDEFVAVFELVKNSFDANSKKVQIIFKDLKDPDKAKLIIADNGKGMDSGEITNKWLFVAYSGKKDGSELKDYRNKIRSNRVFAGAKGVGRFSCDRLGRFLNLISIKDEANPKIEQLTIEWERFETDQKKEFDQVLVERQTLKTTPYKIKYGTVIEITGLRDIWNRDRILKLKQSLAKLINPNQDNDSKNFIIEIVAKGQLEIDALQEENSKIVNGVVKNQLFESLSIKTTNIEIEISEDGKLITTTLQDRGDLIYRITEKNPYEHTLKSINIFLFQLNRSAKISFHNLMGMRSVDYGSVFMYKNGFRVYPFGEEGNDSLKIDRRKAQGYSRFLGLRDLIGRIEINGDNLDLRETTSRDGGLVKTATYENLVKFFYEYVLKRLENYVVKIIEWGDPKYDKDTREKIRDELNPKDVKLKILETITSLANSGNIIDIHYNKELLNILDSKQEKSVENILKNVSKVARDSDKPELLKEIKKIDNAVKSLKKDTDKAINKAEIATSRSNELERKLESQIKETLFARSVVGTETKELLSLQHHITHTSNGVSGFIDILVNKIENNASKKDVLTIISKIDLKIKEIATISKFVTKANFDTKTEKLTRDIITFINEYIENVYKFQKNIDGPKITVHNVPFKSFEKSFRPIDLIILIDNFITNSKKADAKNIKFKWDYLDSDQVNLHIIDDGKGIDDEILGKLFDFRFSTTDGSGLGLYYNQQTIRKFKGKIIVNNKLKSGVEFILTFRR